MHACIFSNNDEVNEDLWKKEESERIQIRTRERSPSPEKFTLNNNNDEKNYLLNLLEKRDEEIKKLKEENENLRKEAIKNLNKFRRIEKLKND